MLEITMATERWAAAHDGMLPHNLAELRGYLAPMILICPASRPGGLPTSWIDFDLKDISYRVRLADTPSYNQWDFQDPNRGSPPSTTWLFCPIHKTSASNRVLHGGIPADQVFRAR